MTTATKTAKRGSPNYLAQIEKGAGSLRKLLPEDAPPQVLRAIRRVERLTRVLQKYPVIDLAYLKRLREYTFRFDQKPDHPVDGEVVKQVLIERDRYAYDVLLRLPHFAVADLDSFRAGGGRLTIPAFSINSLRVGGSYSCGWRNSETNLNAVPRGTRQEQQGFETAVPDIPASVQKTIEKAVPDFDSLHMTFEAEWKRSPLKDPLIIGVLGNQSFLVDQFDATKLERYIVSEHVTNPKP